MSQDTVNPAAHQGKYTHPWLSPLAPGRTKFYNVMHKTLVTGFIAFAAYGFYEVGRGSYYIMKANREKAAQAQVEQAPSS